MKKPGLTCIVIMTITSFFSCSDDGREDELENPQPTTEGLVAYYTFENNTNDLLGNYDAEATGNSALTYSSFGKNKKAVNFSADIETYAVINEAFDYEYKTISFWFKANIITESHDVIFVSDNPNKQYGLVGAVVYEEFGDKFLLMNVGGNPLITTIQTGIWYHITLVGAAKHYAYYINGELFNEGDFDSYLSSFNGEEETILGASRIYTLFFTGSMDNFRIYNRALSPQEIKVLASF